MKVRIYAVLGTLLAVGAAEAKLSVRVDDPLPGPKGTPAKRAGEKSVVKLMLKNTFAEKLVSARATLFLLDEHGKPVEQVTRWVIGGTKERPALAPGASTSYSFVVTTEKPFATTKLLFSRIVLEGGKLADPQTGISFER